MRPASPFRLLRANPLRVLTSPATWSATVYGFSGMLLALPTMIFIALFPLLPVWAWLLSAIERQRVGLVGHESIPGPPASQRVPPWRHVPARLASVLGWREISGTLLHLIFAALTFTLWVFGLTLALTLLFAPFLPVFGSALTVSDWRIDHPAATIPIAVLGIIVLVVFLYAQLALTVVQAMTARVLIGSRVEELEQQVTALAGERVALVDAFEAERRRIENGLAASLIDLADRSPVPVRVDVDPVVRFSDAAEASLYSIATEFIANSLKHSGAHQITITLGTVPDGVHVQLNDDGNGGSDPARGTGLIGITHRVTLLRGTAMLDSPIGGPTTLSIMLPSDIIRTAAHT